jgi:hypothetical protein
LRASLGKIRDAHAALGRPEEAGKPVGSRGKS